MSSNGSDESQGSSHPVIIEKELSHAIVGCFFEVYNELGYGFVESLYARALEIAMRGRGLQVDREYPVIVTFRGQQIGFHRLDMLVERRIIVELKSTERLAESARRQLRSYVTALGIDPRHPSSLWSGAPLPSRDSGKSAFQQYVTRVDRTRLSSNSPRKSTELIL